MSKITINGKQYTDDVDKRFAGCEFCDVRIKDYDYFKEHCLHHKVGERPCGNAIYVKRVNHTLTTIDKEFTHIESTDTCKQAAVHYMEDCQEVDDFVRRGIDEIAERYFCTGAEWMAKKFHKLYAEKFLSMQVSEQFQSLFKR